MKGSSIVADHDLTLTRTASVGKADGRSFWRRTIRAAALATGSLGAGLVGVSAYTAIRLAKPRRTSCTDEPPAGSFESVTFPSTDGLRLTGWLLPSIGAEDTVVLCHGFQTARWELLTLALALRERGHQVLLFDFRGHGDSQGRWSSCGAMETRDLEGAARYLLARPDTAAHRVGVLGFSMGGAVAILAAARVPEIAAVVADSAFATLEEAAPAALWRLYRLPRYPVVALAMWLSERLVGCQVDQARPLDAVADIAPRPILIIHGVEDRIVPPSEAYLLYEAAGEPRELWVVPGADHVAARLIHPEEYLDRVEGFFRRSLRADDVAERDAAPSRVTPPVHGRV